MFNICYVKQYFASFNTLINWLDIFWNLCHILYFKFYIIFFLLCIKSKKILVGHESETNLFHAFHLTFILKINLVLPLAFKVINVKNLHSKNLKC